MTIALDEAMQRAEAGQLLTRRHGEALANAVKSSRAKVAELTAELAGVREELRALLVQTVKGSDT